jgi:hypothetical protein
LKNNMIKNILKGTIIAALAIVIFIFTANVAVARINNPSGGGSGGMSIGGAVTTGGNGSVLFVDGGGNLAQDTSVFNYDNSNKSFGLGTTGSSSGKFNITDIALAGSGSLAGSAINIAQTWNTTGTVSAILANITNTASNAGSSLINLQVGGSSVFKVIASTGHHVFGTNVSNIGIGPASSTAGTADVTGTALRYVGAVGSSAGAYLHWFISSNGRTPASGTNGFMRLTETFAPTSGTAVYNMLTLTPTINQTGVTGTPITRGLYINPTLTAASDYRAIEVTDGKIVVPTTVTAGGTTGAQTINKISGTVNLAAAATSLVVTNSLVSTTSLIMPVVRTNDSTCAVKNVVAGAGSFTINMTAACTAETSVGFFVLNS